jgi:hypothetical protein
MKSILSAILFLLTSGVSFGQTRIQEGRYTSADGFYSFEVKYVAEGLQVDEPNRTNLYTLGSDGMYHHSEAQYSKYYIRIVSANELRTGSGRSTESVFTYSGPALQILSSDEAFSEECMEVAEKYQNLAKDDFETQAWTFCAMAAMLKCTTEPEGFEAYAREIVLSLRTMVVNQNKCPCEDVISPTIWNRYR